MLREQQCDQTGFGNAWYTSVTQMSNFMNINTQPTLELQYLTRPNC